MSALTYKAKDNKIVVIEDIKVDAPNTKQMLAVLNSLKVADQKLLLVNADYDANFYLSVRNLPKVKASVLSDINTYDILNAKTLVLTESAAKVFTDAVEVEA
ncbi:50S ribosomal protein L4 [compost metagenome]